MEQRELEHILKKKFDPNYSVGEKIGEGGFGTVYELLGHPEEAVVKVVDLKAQMYELDAPDFILRKMEERYRYFVETTRNEIAFLKELKDSPYFTSVIDAKEFKSSSEKNENVFIIIQKKYQSLKDAMYNREVNESQILKMAKDICMALMILEEHKLLHRDIKPDNIFIKWKDGVPYYAIGDFGLTRRLEEETGEVTQIGTPYYVAPEVAFHQKLKGFNSDIYGLGATLFTVVTGDCLVDSRGPVFERISNIMPNFARIIEKATRQDPEERYQHASDMMRDLEKVNIDGSKQRVVYLNSCLSEGKAKLAIGDIEGALKTFEKGTNSKMKGIRMASFRMMIYIRLLLMKDTKKLTSKEVEELLEIARQGDSVGQYLYGVYLMDQKQVQEGLKYIQMSANNGCEIAENVYGYMLFQGYETIPRNRKEGIKYIELAAKHGYVPAIRRLQKIKERYGECYHPSVEMIEVLDKTAILNYNQRKAEFAIPYL